MTPEKQAFQTGFLITLFDLTLMPPMIFFEQGREQHYMRGVEQALLAIKAEECIGSRWFMRNIMDWREKQSRKVSA